MEIAGIIISIIALWLSIISFIQSQKIKKIENYLNYGSPKEIELKISHLNEKLKAALAEIEREFKNKIREADIDFARRNISGGVQISKMNELDDVKKRRIEKLKSEINKEIELLNLRKEHIYKI